MSKSKFIKLAGLIVSSTIVLPQSVLANNQAPQIVIDHIEPTLVRDCFHNTNSTSASDACQEAKEGFWDLQFLRKNGLYYKEPSSLILQPSQLQNFQSLKGNELRRVFDIPK